MNENAPIPIPPRESRFRRAARVARDWLQHPSAKRVAAAGSVLTVIAGLVGTAGNLERVPVYLCRVPGIHALCSRLEIGEVAGREEQRAWDDAQSSKDPRALRAYLAAFPTGVYASEASTRLAACRTVQREAWTGETRTLPLYVPASAGRGATLDAARAQALRSGEQDATALCAGFTGEFRLRSSGVEAREWQCRERKDGASCSFDGLAVCKVDARHVLSEETCG